MTCSADVRVINLPQSWQDSEADVRSTGPLECTDFHWHQGSVGGPKGFNMLVLSRKPDEQIIIGDGIVVTVVEIRGDKVRLGIEAPREVSVHRQEVLLALKRSAPTEAAKSDSPPQ